MTVGELWNYFAEYYYMMRLVDKNVSIDAVSKGVAEKTFALAESRDGEKFIGLRFGDIACKDISDENFLVKAEVSQAQIDSQKPPVEPDAATLPVKPVKIEPPLPKKFSMSAELDNIRYINDIKRQILRCPARR